MHPKKTEEGFFIAETVKIQVDAAELAETVKMQLSSLGERVLAVLGSAVGAVGRTPPT